MAMWTPLGVSVRARTRHHANRRSTCAQNFVCGSAGRRRLVCRRDFSSPPVSAALEKTKGMSNNGRPSFSRCFSRRYAREEAERFVWQRRRTLFASLSLFDEPRSAAVLSGSDHLCSRVVVVLLFFCFALFPFLRAAFSRASLRERGCAGDERVRRTTWPGGSSSRELYLVPRQQR